MVDINNTATVGATSGMFSSAEDMQELVRRIAHICGVHGIALKPVHTPGDMLHRPDQTSRGAPVEEPRQRFTVDAFRPLEDQWGPFTEMLGAEMVFAVESAKVLKEKHGVKARVVSFPCQRLFEQQAGPPAAAVVGDGRVQIEVDRRVLPHPLQLPFAAHPHQPLRDLAHRGHARRLAQRIDSIP